MAITNDITGASQASTLDCCGDCDSPVLIGHIFQGDTMIPFSLAMPDGTLVEEIHSGNSAKIVDGFGVIEIEPARHGQQIELKVREEKCQAISCLYVVSPRDRCISCGDVERCDIKIKNLELRVVGDFYGDILNLEVESYRPVEYKLENSGWVSNWREIPNFELNKTHILYLRSGDCTIQHEIFVENQIVYVPTTVYQNVPVSTPVVVNVPSQILIPTPSTVLVGVPNLVPTPVAVLVNVPTAVVVPQGVSTPISTPISTPVVCPTPVAVPVGTPVSLMNAQITIIKRPSCFNGSNGCLGLKVTGGTSPYTYAWTRNGSVSAVSLPTFKNRGFINNSGLWQVVITDSLGQTLTKSVNLLALNSSLIVVNQTTTPPSSDVSTDGVIGLAPTGGTPPYRYYWKHDGSTLSSASGLSNGSYGYIYVDAVNCAGLLTPYLVASMATPYLIVFQYTFISFFTHNVIEVYSAVATIRPPTSGETFTYLWSSGQTTSIIDNPPSGILSCTITGSLGTVLTETITIVVPLAKMVNISITNSSGGLANGSISVTSLSNTIGVISTYHLLNTTTNEYYTNPSALKTGTYTIDVFTTYGERITRAGVVIL